APILKLHFGNEIFGKEKFVQNETCIQVNGIRRESPCIVPVFLKASFMKSEVHDFHFCTNNNNYDSKFNQLSSNTQSNALKKEMKRHLPRYMNESGGNIALKRRKSQESIPLEYIKKFKVNTPDKL